MITEWVMLVMATAMTRIRFVDTRTTNELSFHSELTRTLLAEEELTPEFTEQWGNTDSTADKKARVIEERRALMKNEEHNTYTKGYKTKVVRQIDPDDMKKQSMHSEEVDVVDREDHVTQYLADLLVNTDSEITSLQASETEDERDGIQVKEDSFFAFVTGQEKAVEVEGMNSSSLSDDSWREDRLLNQLGVWNKHKF